MFRKTVIILVCAFVAASLIIFGYLSRERGNPVENLEVFTSVLRDKYALFQVKEMDPDLFFAKYAGKIDKESSDDELFQVMSHMMKELDDKHCYIHRFNEIYFSGFGLGPMNYLQLTAFDFREEGGGFSRRNVIENYLEEDYHHDLKIVSYLPPMGIRHVFTWGSAGRNCAYIHMTEMSSDHAAVRRALNKFLEGSAGARGFIIDLRDNIGGYSLPVKMLAEYFTDTRHLYAVSRKRKGDGLGDPEYWYLEPREGTCSRKPVVILINRNTQSAAELFLLMMKDLPNVTIMGEKSAGIFADTERGLLPNGWEYRISVRSTGDRDDISFEGWGIDPDFTVFNSEKEIRGGIDRVLERALQMIDEASD